MLTTRIQIAQLYRAYHQLIDPLGIQNYLIVQLNGVLTTRVFKSLMQLYRHKLFNSSNIYAAAPLNSPTIQSMGPFNTQSLTQITVT